MNEKERSKLHGLLRAYAEAERTNLPRAPIITAVEDFVRMRERAAVHEATGEALNTGSGTYKP